MFRKLALIVSSLVFASVTSVFAQNSLQYSLRDMGGCMTEVGLTTALEGEITWSENLTQAVSCATGRGVGSGGLISHRSGQLQNKTLWNEMNQGWVTYTAQNSFGGIESVTICIRTCDHSTPTIMPQAQTAPTIIPSVPTITPQSLPCQEYTQTRTPQVIVDRDCLRVHIDHNTDAKVIVRVLRDSTFTLLGTWYPPNGGYEWNEVLLNDRSHGWIAGGVFSHTVDSSTTPTVMPTTVLTPTPTVIACEAALPCQLSVGAKGYNNAQWGETHVRTAANDSDSQLDVVLTGSFEVVGGPQFLMSPKHHVMICWWQITFTPKGLKESVTAWAPEGIPDQRWLLLD
ncbi:MAG: hypothetical protein ABI758_01925 [Candidatus Woesebacteria bacterium]